MLKTLDIQSYHITISLPDLKLDYGLLVAIITLLATSLFFYHQNCKTKQHLCLDEIIKRLELINSLVKSSFSPADRRYELYSEFTFQAELLRYGIEKFNTSEPYSTIKSLSKTNRDQEALLVTKLVELVEYIEMKTPIESPSNFDTNSESEVERIKIILEKVNTSSTFIIKQAYTML
jgi:hypothetical protein